VQPDQRQHATADEEVVVALAGRACQPGVRLDLGDRIIPVSCQEAL
jgi:hypothetical protein